MNMINKFLSLLLLVVSMRSFSSQEITGANVFANHKVGKIKLHHKNDGFFVEQDGNEYTIKKHWMDPELRKISKKQLNAFLGNGYFAVNKLENGDFTLKAKVRGLGGGPVGVAVGTLGGAALVQGTYNGALAGLGMVLTPFVSPVGAAAIVGTVRWATYPAALVATKTVALAGGIALGVATGPF